MNFLPQVDLSSFALGPHIVLSCETMLLGHLDLLAAFARSQAAGDNL